MSDIPGHIRWLTDTGERLTTSDGKIVEVWEFHHQLDEKVLTAWAKHFRNHYCTDDEIDYFRRGYGCSRSEYLTRIKFPDQSKAPGPSIRSGDFGEILVADYLEYILGFWVPRVRYGTKVISNESSKGCDTLGFRFFKNGEESPRDVLAIYETKARLTKDQLTNDTKVSGFQAAINDSIKDEIRKAESLNYIKQLLFYKDKFSDADRIDRFQNPKDHPYRELSGAVALFSTDSYNPATITSAKTDEHPNKGELLLIVICGEQLMDLVHDLYRRATDEA